MVVHTIEDLVVIDLADGQDNLHWHNNRMLEESKMKFFRPTIQGILYQFVPQWRPEEKWASFRMHIQQGRKHQSFYFTTPNMFLVK